MLGILANFEKEDRYEAVKAIVDQLQSVITGNFAESRYFEKMRDKKAATIIWRLRRYSPPAGKY